VCLEREKIKREIINLKKLLNTEGFTPNEVHDMIEKNNENYKKVAEKALCRLHIFGESSNRGSNMYLKPLFLDKWKKYTKVRKIYGHWIRRLNEIAKLEKMDMREVFSKWFKVVNKKRC
jgi:hypothetical protein